MASLLLKAGGDIGRQVCPYGQRTLLTSKMPPLSCRFDHAFARVPSILWLLAVGCLTGATDADARSRAADLEAPTLTVSALQQDAVTLSWLSPPGVPLPDGYQLEGGVLPGQSIAAFPLSGQTASFSIRLGPGVYYARLYAVQGGTRSQASNEVRFGIGLGDLPSAPQEIAALALGSDVVLRWRPSFAGGPTDSVDVDVSGPINSVLSLPPSGEMAFGDVPSGVYTLTFRGRNATGIGAEASPLTVVLPGGAVVPKDVPPGEPNAPRLPVRYENPAAPRLAQFAHREQLAVVVQGASSEFDALLRLKNWVAAQWPMGDPNPYPPWDAMTILDWIRSGQTGGFCGQYSQVFLQALAAYGIPARYLEVGVAAFPANHYTTEVWSNEFSKWVLLDVAFNLHFDRGGIPLSALEVHEALVGNRLGDVQVVLGTARAGLPSPYDWPQRTAELYYYLRYHLNGNHVSAPDEPPFERFDDMIEWVDNRTVPWQSSQVAPELPHYLLTARSTGDRAVVEWQPNRVWITPRRIGAMQYALDLQHTMLHPSHYEMRVLDSAGNASPWRTETGSTAIWRVGVDDREVQVRGVNVTGIRGPVSSVRLTIP
jgi:hypothetical protein